MTSVSPVMIRETNYCRTLFVSSSALVSKVVNYDLTLRAILDFDHVMEAPKFPPCNHVPPYLFLSYLIIIFYVVRKLYVLS